MLISTLQSLSQWSDGMSTRFTELRSRLAQAGCSEHEVQVEDGGSGPLEVQPATAAEARSDVAGSTGSDADVAQDSKFGSGDSSTTHLSDADYHQPSVMSKHRVAPDGTWLVPLQQQQQQQRAHGAAMDANGGEDADATSWGLTEAEVRPCSGLQQACPCMICSGVCGLLAGGVASWCHHHCGSASCRFDFG